jgi:hypothetical protein
MPGSTMSTNFVDIVEPDPTSKTQGLHTLCSRIQSPFMILVKGLNINRELGLAVVPIVFPGRLLHDDIH